MAFQNNPENFVDDARIIHPEFVPEGTTVNSHWYLGVMNCLPTRMCSVRNEQFWNHSWLLSRDNATALCASNVMQFGTSKSICVTQRPLWSPDLTPADFSSFWRQNWP